MSPVDRFRQAHMAAEEAVDVLNDAAIEYGTCACTTCIVREALNAAWPILREAALAGEDVD